VFSRGAPEGLPRVLVPVWDVTLYDLLKAYGDGRQRKEGAVLHIEPPELYSMDDALQRLSRILGRLPDWRSLMSFLPPHSGGDGLVWRSAIASTFSASLELVRAGKLQLRQDSAFGPIYLRSPPETP
jgi:segregation and condensation protein A